MSEVLLALAAALAAATLDQLTKLAVVRRLTAGRVPLVGTWLGLRCGLNRRGGPLRLSNRAALALAVAALATLGTLVATVAPPLAVPHAVGLGLLVGGAAGNLADRLARGGVVDFIDLRWWPTFNVADAAMVAGTGLAVWAVL